MKKFNFLLSLASLGLILSSCGGGDNPAHEHRWGTPHYVWSSDNSSCTAERVCELNSSHIDKETVSSNYEVTIEPTTTSDGEGTYTASFSKDYFLTQTKTVVIPPIGHEHTYSEKFEFDSTHHWHPSTCGHDVISGKAEHQFTSVTEEGKTTYTCSTCEYSYSVGGDKFLEYKDNPDLVRLYPELNAALKAFLANRSFTMEHSQVYENEQYCDTYSYKPAVVYVNGSISTTMKFAYKDYESEIFFTGEAYLLLDPVLAVYEVSSWAELTQNQEKLMYLSSTIRSALYNAGDIYEVIAPIDLTQCVVKNGKVMLTEGMHIINAEYYDEANEQYFISASDGNKTQCQYIVPDNYMVFQCIDQKYSILEQFAFYASRWSDYETNHITYDPETHSYDREYWGSGASRFDMRNVCPIVVEDGAITSLHGMSITKIGSTTITSSKVPPVCSHSHGTHQFWFNEDYHADYCDDCGKALTRHQHNINNSHDFCVECGHFSSGLSNTGFDQYFSEHEELNEMRIYINPNTGKKYMYLYETPMPVSSGFEGKDGKFYRYFSSAPTDGVTSEVLKNSSDTIENSYLQSDFCIYSIRYNIDKITYNTTYSGITLENIPDDRISEAEYIMAHYFYTNKELVSKDTLETVYLFPNVHHPELTTSNTFTKVEYEEVYRKVNRIFLQSKYSGNTLTNYTFVKTTCSHCGQAIYGMIPNDGGEGTLLDCYGSPCAQRIGVMYTWESDYSDCTAALFLYYDGERTVILEEHGTVVDDEVSTITASFSNPVFTTQYYHYYG